VQTIDPIFDSSFSISAAVSSIARKGNFCKASARHHPEKNCDKENCKSAGSHKEPVGKSKWSVPFRNILLPLVTMALLTGCPTQAKKVLIIGDSISFVASGNLVQVGNEVAENSVTNRILFTVVANGGIGAYSRKDNDSDYWNVLIPNIIDDGELDAVVVQLGTNDCVHVVNGPGDYLPYIRLIIDSIKSADAAVPIFWLTMNQFDDNPTCAEIVNNDLVTAGIQTLPYGQWAQSHPECFADKIHPRVGWRKEQESGGTGAGAPDGYCNGRTAYAAWLKAQLDTFFGPAVN
jgi:hypothetical protein